MVYECDQCSAPLPRGVLACPQCGENFDEAVPADAVLPKTGFSAASALTEEELNQELNQELTSKLEQAESDITTLRGQALVLKSEVMTLRGYVSTLTSEITALEEYSATLKTDSAILQTASATLQSQVTTLTNRLTVLEMAGREDKRRFIDHVNHVKEALGYIQINGPTSVAGQ